MTEPAYDLTPDRIRDLIRAGERMWRLSRPEPPEMSDVLWTLFGEAAQTLRGIQVNRPGGFGSSWPSIAEMAQGAYENAVNIERNEARGRGQALDPDLYRLPPKTRPQPSAAALQRLLDTMSLLRWVRCKNAAHVGARQKLLLALAGGMSPTRAAEHFPEFGYRNKNAVLAAKHRSLLSIEEAIIARCGVIYLNVAA